MNCILGDFLFPFSGDTERVHWKRMGQNKDEHRYDVDYAVKVIFNFFHDGGIYHVENDLICSAN